MVNYRGYYTPAQARKIKEEKEKKRVKPKSIPSGSANPSNKPSDAKIKADLARRKKIQAETAKKKYYTPNEYNPGNMSPKNAPKLSADEKFKQAVIKIALKEKAKEQSTIDESGVLKPDKNESLEHYKARLEANKN